MSDEGNGDGHFERVALGALLLNPRALDEVRPWLRAEDFTWPIHRAGYEAALRLRDRGDPVDPVTVLAQLQRQQYPDPEQRLAVYYIGMDDVVPVPASATYYCQLVLERSVRRDIEAAGIRLRQISTQGMGTPDELLDAARTAQQPLVDAGERWARSEAPRRARDAAAVQERDGELYGVPGNQLAPGRNHAVIARAGDVEERGR